MIPLSYNLRSLTVRKATTVATLVGIGLVVFVFASVLMLGNGIERLLDRSGRADTALILRFGSDAELASGIQNQQVLTLRGNPKVLNGQAIGEVVVGITCDKAGGGGISNVQVRGVPADVLDFRPEVAIVDGRRPQPGTDEVMIGRGLRGRFVGVDLDQSFPLKKNRPVKVVGVFAANGSSFESEIWGDIDVVRSAFGREGIVSSIRARLASPSDFDAFKTDVESDRNLALAVERESAYYQRQSGGMTMFVMGLGITIAIFFSFGAMVGAAITMYATVAHRGKEIGTLRALGFSKTSILSSFLFESVVLALAGGVVGSLAALLMGTRELALLNNATFSQIIVRFEARPGILLWALGFAMIMGLVGGFFPAWRASRLSPVQAMRE